MSVPVLAFHDLSFTWPDGDRVLESVNATFSGVTGLIGRNGAGKSTLVRLISGELTPTSGTLTRHGSVGVLPQNLTLRTDETVADLLGIAEALHAVRAVAAGEVDPQLYDRIGNDWDIEARARAALAAAGMTGVDVDRPVGELSGGEAMLTALIGLKLARPAIAVLDEPTNNLDRHARRLFVEILKSWPGSLLLCSHDEEALELAQQIAHLEDGQLRLYGGGYQAYCEQRAAEEVTAEQAVASAKQRLRVEKRQLIETQTKLARRARHGRADVARSKFIGAAADGRRRRAEQTAGRVSRERADRLERAEQQVADAEAGLRREHRAVIRLPDPHLASQRQLARLTDGERSHLIVGPQRTALRGDNGVGKTRLLQTLFGREPFGSLQAQPLCENLGYLPQRLDEPDPNLSVLDVVAQAAPTRTSQQLRAQLAGFGLDATTVALRLARLSGGEQVMVALARILLAEPAPQLVVLDEPTNNLDRVTVESLREALNAYRGALLVVSHDDRFLAGLGMDTWLDLIAGPHGPRLIDGDQPPTSSPGTDSTDSTR